MKTEYLYVFGYQTPEDSVASEGSRSEQESFGFFRIVADSEEEALGWGHHLSIWYTAQLFGNDGGEPHWDAHWFASWIEHAPDEQLREAACAVGPVAVHEYPDLNQVREVFAD